MSSNHLNLCHPFSSCSQFFPALGSFPMSWLFPSGGQSIGASASASVLPMNIQGWFPLGLSGLISLLPKRLSRVFSSTTFECINSSALWLLYGQTLTLVYDSWEKSIALTIGTSVGKVMSLIFNMLSGFVRAFLSRSMCLLISWLQSTSAVIGAQENKICHCFYFFPIYLSWSDGTGWHNLSFLNVEF